jgi:dTDP-4-dehydrorhamnose reductase
LRVLVTGAAGQVGREVVAACQRAGDEVVVADRAVLDVTDRATVLGAIGSTRPDVVVHTAAWTAVDACEADPGMAMQVNGLAVRWVAEACHRSGAHLVHLSTDYVFSGDKAVPYHEWDDPAPRSAYGRSKLAGEREAGPEATIVRTSWVCGAHGTNMVRTILGLAETQPKLTVVDDQRGHPTFAPDLAAMVRRLAVDRRPGLHHVTNQGAVSWFEFARCVLSAAGEDPDRVVAISTAELQPPRVAHRPANSLLDNAVLRLSGIPLLDDFREPLARLVEILRGS